MISFTPRARSRRDDHADRGERSTDAATGAGRSRLDARRADRTITGCFVLTVALLLAAPAGADDDPSRLPLDAVSSTVHFMDGSGRVADAGIALERGEHAKAIAHARAALEEPLSRSDRLAALNALCVGYVADGRAAAAMRYCDRVVAETWGDWRARNNRGNARLAVGDLDGAIRDYREAVVALDAKGGEHDVRQYGRTGWQSGREMLIANLDLAERRQSDDWQLAASPPPPAR